MNRGEIWLANLDPTRGSEQAGSRPVIIFQNDILLKYTSTILTIPLTTNLRRALLPSCILIKKEDGELPHDSVALCHQLRVLDKIRLIRKIGTIQKLVISSIEKRVLFTMGVI